MTTMTDKTARADHAILEPIKNRWSPRAFSDRAVELDKLLSILEAARWAASSANEQPWRFIVAARDQRAEYERLLGCLKERNQSWAKAAPVLMLTFAKDHFGKNETGKNRHAFYDVGLAVGNLVIQATALGLYLHQMAGFYPHKVREAYAVPAAFEPVTALALGYLGDPDTLPGDLRRRELAERSRKPLSELVFAATWGEAAAFVQAGDS